MKKIVLIIAFISLFSYLNAGLWDDGLWMHNYAGGSDLYPQLNKDSGLGQNIFWYEWGCGSTETVYTMYQNFGSANRWCDNSTRSVNSVYDITFYNTGYPNKDNFAATNGNYYTFRFLVPSSNNGYANTKPVILETSAVPVTIDNVSFIYNGAGNDATVNITLSGNKCNEEYVYVRHTDNAGVWGNDAFVQASGSGTSYSATILGTSVSTSTEFYVLTTTLTWSSGNDLDNYPDLMTLKYNNNGGSNYTLPVELSTFTAQYLNSKPTLYWTTQSETDNMGWFVYRNQVEDFTSATKVSGMIEGHGTTTQMQSYIYEDVIANPQVGDVYYYWLESVDYSGTIHHFNKVAMITIPETNDPNNNVVPPHLYDLISSPNPFNESTKITFTLTQSAMVDVAIYDVKGALVKLFDSQHVTADDLVSLQWNGKDEQGKTLSNGIYLYSVKVNGQEYETKQLILMK